jgi:hypothetical protein
VAGVIGALTLETVVQILPKTPRHSG